MASRAVIAQFGKEFAKTGLLDVKHHQALIEAFNLRQKVEYDYTTTINRETAQRVLEGCRELVEQIRAYLQRKGYLT